MNKSAPNPTLKTSDPWMTVKLGEGSGDEGIKKLGKRSEDGEEEAVEGAGGEPENEESSNSKTEEHINPSSSSSSSTNLQQTSSPLQPSQTQDQHHFLRSSVRPPSKRLRKDPLAFTSGTTSSNAKGKGSENGAVISGCVPGIPPSSSAGSSKSAARNLGSASGEKEEGNKKKVRRQWESWSAEDKNSFFEGLYEHGKDFEAIQNNIALKYKKKGKPASMVKNKEQVRHFYYRTWHKITKYIDFDNVFSRGLKKSSLELYGLICYGELRKKVGGCMDDKNAAKLNELIQVGATTVRYKGRNLRIKAPMCRALKKICDPDGISDEEDQKPVRLPLKVPVELQPRTNHAWARVQSLAQNPRLRMIVELHRKVSSLIEFLKQKWALHEVRIRKSLEDRQLQDCREGDSQEEKAEFHLYPPESSSLALLPGVARVVHSKAFCTVHWQETGKCKPSAKDTHVLPPAQILGIQGGQGTGVKTQLKHSRAVVEGRKPETTTDSGRPVDFMTDNAQGYEENLRDGNLSEETTPSLGSPDCWDSPTYRPPDPGENAEKVADLKKTNLAAAAASPGESPCAAGLKPGGANCVCGGMVDTEELSLLDPFPRYVKSCQDLMVPERCICTDRLFGKEGVNSALNCCAPGSLEALDRNTVQLSCPSSCPSSSETQTNCSQRSYSEANPRELLADGSFEDCQEKSSMTLLSPSQGQSILKLSKDDPNRHTQQVREEGWNMRTSEKLTLAEIYLMLGKPSKLQLEYDWVPSRTSETEETGEQGSDVNVEAAFHKQKLLKCLLRLIATEVNPKPCPETISVATSPMKSVQEEQSFTPPGKVITLNLRSPGCSRNPSTIRNSKAFSPTTASSSLRNLPRSLLVAGPSTSGNSDTDSGVFAVPTTFPPNSRHGKLFSPSKEAELSFRQQLDSISSDIFLPKQRKLRNRHLRKPLVVQRTLLPRPSGNPSQHVCSFSILSNSSVTGTGSFRPIQSTLSKATVSRPIVPKAVPAPTTNHLSSAIDLAAQSAGIIPGSSLHVLETERSTDVAPLSPSSASTAMVRQDAPGSFQNGIATAKDGDSVGGRRVPFITLSTQTSKDVVTDSLPDGNLQTVLPLPELPKPPLENGLSTSPARDSSALLSPPNMSSLLDISLPGPPEDVLSQGEPATEISDSIIELAINSSEYDGVPLSPAKLNGSDSSKSLPSPSASPQRNWIASPTHDPQWYPNDSTDSSLGSLLSSLISPEKGRKMLTPPPGNSSETTILGPSLLDGSSRDSFVSRSLVDVAEVDSQLACMMSESSIDYISRFNDLAQELSVAEPTRKEILFDGGGS
nr:PREDICTED: protein cramped-like isoform X2 [Latimeria chalumnae]|eukprot:XP_014344998.1 PREDICTED: protein cramped-like isoform X2 [Latimeria chalumnae]